MTFFELAKQLDQEIKTRSEALDLRSSQLDEKASLLAVKEAELEAERIRLVNVDRQNQMNTEEATRKMMIVATGEDAVRIRDEGNAKLASAEKKLKEANDKLLEAQQNLDELSKRELALSEREKTYKQEIENEVLRNIAFRK